MADDISKRLEDAQAQLELLTEAHEGAAKAARKQLIAEQNLAKAIEQNSDEVETFRQKVDEARASQLEHQQEIVDYLKLIGKLREEERERNKALAEQQRLIDQLSGATASLTGINAKQLASISGLTSAFMEQAKAVNEAATELSKATGFSKELNRDMMDLAKSNKALGTTVATAGAAIAGLNTEFKEFAALSGTERARINQIAIELEAVGANAVSTGKVMDIFSRSLGMTATQAAEATYMLDQFAQQVGLPTSQIMEDFAALMPQMARFGNRGIEEMKRLTKEARSMGIAVQEAFNIAEAFDTFEGAANLAGQLNAQLGIQLNSVDLMRASHADRLKMLKQEFDLRGKNFQTMRRRERQAVAEMLGVDIDMASRIFGDPVELRKYQKEQEETSKRAKAFTSITTKLSAALQNVAIQFEPVINGFITLMTFFAENQGVAMFVAITAALIGIAMALGQVAPFLALVIPSLTSLGPATGAAAPGVEALGAAFAMAAPHILRGAGGMLLIAGSFYVISKALETFVAVEWSALGKAAVTLVGLTAALFGLGALIGNPVGIAMFGAGVAGILALSVALAALGLAMQSVGAGLQMIGDTADSFEKIINVSTQVDPAGLTRMHEVVDEIVRVGAVAQGGTAGILREVANAIQTAATAMGNAPAATVTGNVVLDGKRLGTWVADNENRRNSLTAIS